MKQLFRALLFSGLLFSVAATPAIAEEAAEQAERVQVGQTAPPIILESSDGTTYELAQRGEKDLVVIFFRGTW